MAEEELLFRREDGVGIITLNRPEKHNAMSSGMREGLLRVMKEMEDDQETRALVMTGAGRSFCSGADVTAMRTGGEARADQEVQQRRPVSETSYYLAMRNCKKIIVGAISGYALGPGFSLALACDIRIAAEDARLGALQGRIGQVVNASLSYVLPRMVGTQKALELTISGATGKMLDAEEALRLGLVTKVVPRPALMDEAMELAQQITKGPPIAFALSKEGFYKGMEVSFEAALEWEQQAVDFCSASEDCHEGVRAVMEKRAPVFKGR